MTASEYDGTAAGGPPHGGADTARPAGFRDAGSGAARAVLPLAEALSACRADLAGAGIADPGVDAALLAAHVLGVSRGRVEALAILGTGLDAGKAGMLRRLTARRCTREPLQHITGTAAFRSFELAVGPGVFVPRPETETVAGLAVDALRAAPGDAPLGVDLGTGSGAIALAMALEVPGSRILAVERSDAAIVWARRNAAALAPGRLRVLHGDLALLPSGVDGTVDVIASNPPYVPDAEVPADPEVHDHDPAAALYGGPDGLEVIRVIARRAAALARPGGVIVLEHGERQGAAVRAILAEHGWRDAATRPDPTGRDRATTAVR